MLMQSCSIIVQACVNKRIISKTMIAQADMVKTIKKGVDSFFNHFVKLNFINSTILFIRTRE